MFTRTGSYSERRGGGHGEAWRRTGAVRSSVIWSPNGAVRARYDDLRLAGPPFYRETLVCAHCCKDLLTPKTDADSAYASVTDVGSMVRWHRNAEQHQNVSTIPPVRLVGGG